jgi:hypothetical protein
MNSYRRGARSHVSKKRPSNVRKDSPDEVTKHGRWRPCRKNTSSGRSPIASPSLSCACNIFFLLGGLLFRFWGSDSRDFGFCQGGFVALHSRSSPRGATERTPAGSPFCSADFLSRGPSVLSVSIKIFSRFGFVLLSSGAWVRVCFTSYLNPP